MGTTEKITSESDKSYEDIFRGASSADQGGTMNEHREECSLKLELHVQRP